MSEPIKPLDLDLDLDLDFTELDRSEDELFAPADVSELPSAALSLSVPTLTNSPGCVPARPIRRARSVQVDAWSAPAPANWGRGRRTVRKVQSKGSGRGRRAATASPSSDWALPF
ncbi:MAG: hypothetical protein AAGC67_07505 [Myxococcota bacterium]